MLYQRLAVVLLASAWLLVLFSTVYFHHRCTHDQVRESSTVVITTTNRLAPIFHNRSSSKSIDREEIDFEHEYSRLSCKFARLDPFDQQILKFIKHPRQLRCDRVQPFDLSFVDEEGQVRLNRSEWMRATKNETSKPGEIACYCRGFDRPRGRTENDFDEIYNGPWELLEPHYPLRIPSDSLEVVCANKTSRTVLYWNLHAHPMLAGKREFKNVEDAEEDRLSVIMLVIDSVSLSTLIRHLPRTYKYLTEEMGFVVFKGYNKVADNTRPNMFPVVTGKRLQSEQDDMPQEIENVKNFLDDSAPELIWQRFARLNYSTMMNEDYADFGMFHYGSKGYHYKPADFYYHSLWMLLDEMAKKLHSSRYCFGNTPKIQFQINLTRKHLELFRRKLQFVFTFFAELSHDDSNAIEMADDLFLEFFRGINRPETIDRSVIVFMSDHGHRFSRVRETLIGLLEERQPMLTLRFPPWFYEKYPEIRRNLQLNTMRLISPFDIHETLLDILNLNFGGKQRDFDARARSILYPIERNRTCTSAGIPDHFCLCEQQEEFDAKSSLVTSASKYLITYLNDLLDKSRRDSSIIESGTSCQTWTLNSILRVEKLGISQKIKDYTNSKKGFLELLMETSPEKSDKNRLEIGERLRIAARMNEREALFEVEMLSTGKDEWRVLGQLNRLDAYGNQSWCVHDEIIRKYCICELVVVEKKNKKKTGGDDGDDSLTSSLDYLEGPDF